MLLLGRGQAATSPTMHLANQLLIDSLHQLPSIRPWAPHAVPEGHSVCAVLGRTMPQRLLTLPFPDALADAILDGAAADF